jgi:hypothetical protein
MIHFENNAEKEITLMIFIILFLRYLGSVRVSYPSEETMPCRFPSFQPRLLTLWTWLRRGVWCSTIYKLSHLFSEQRLLQSLCLCPGRCVPQSNIVK